MTPLSFQQQPRFNLYTSIHKGLRAFMAQVLVDVGSLDLRDQAALTHTKEQVSALFMFCRGHLAHEDACIHPALEAVLPAASQNCASDHIEHIHSLNHLEMQLEQAFTLAVLQAQDASVVWLEFYLHLSYFVSENFEHMMREEVEQMGVLWAHYSDDELKTIHQQILSDVSPEDMQTAFRWMIPSIAHQDRVLMLKGMQAQLPEEKFMYMLTAAMRLLPEAERAKLAQVFIEFLAEAA